MRRALCLILASSCAIGDDKDSDDDTDVLDTDGFETDETDETDPACVTEVPTDLPRAPQSAFEVQVQLGFGLSACVEPGVGWTGHGWEFERYDDDGADLYQCLQGYTTTSTAPDSCPSCDYSFDVTWDALPGVGFDLDPVGSCDVVETQLPSRTRLGFVADDGSGSPQLMHYDDRTLAWEPLTSPDGALTVSEVDGQQRIEFLWVTDYTWD